MGPGMWGPFGQILLPEVWGVAALLATGPFPLMPSPLPPTNTLICKAFKPNRVYSSFELIIATLSGNLFHSLLAEWQPSCWHLSLPRPHSILVLCTPRRGQEGVIGCLESEVTPIPPAQEAVTLWPLESHR